MNQPTTSAEVKPELKPAGYQSRLREGRLAAGWSLKAVGDALGKTLQYVGQFEKGRNEMTVSQLLQACAALHLRTDYVLHGTGPMFTPAGPPPPTKQTGRPAARK